MDLWFTAEALAGVGGLPAAPRNVRRKADREGWARRDQGGRLEYALLSLPPAARAALARIHGERPGAAPLSEPEREAAWEAFNRLSERARAEGERRATILAEAEAHQRASGRGRGEALARVGATHGESPATLRRWFAAVRGAAPVDRAALLAPRWGGGRPRTAIPEEAWRIFLSDYLRSARPAARACYERLGRVARERRWALPSYAAFLRRLRETPRELVVLRREGPEALKALTPAQERDHGVFRALQAVSGDGHKLDLWCRWPDGTVSRPILVAFQDVYSGKVLAWRLGKTESAELVRLTLGDMVETFGVPEAAYLDNGMAWAAKTNTGGAPTRYRHKITEEEIAGTFTLLGIAVHWCLPYSGQSKPIERAFRDLCEYVARHPVCEGAYTGNRPENKPYTAGERAVALEDLEGLLASELAEHNARRGRRSAVCGGTLSFDEAFEASYANATVRKATREQRAIWLLASAVVTASRTSGEVRLHGNRYFDPVLARLQGKKLAVRYDPKDLHAGIHVYLLGGGYVCYAPRLGRPGFKDAEAAGEKAKTLKRARRAARELEAAADLLSPLEVAKALRKRLAPKPPAAKAVEVDFRRPLEKSVAWKVPMSGRAMVKRMVAHERAEAREKKRAEGGRWPAAAPGSAPAERPRLLTVRKD